MRYCADGQFLKTEIYRLVIKRPNMTSDDSQDAPALGSGDKVELGAPAGETKDAKKKCGC